jgi:hypothetical protein
MDGFGYVVITRSVAEDIALRPVADNDELHVRMGFPNCLPCVE